MKISKKTRNILLSISIIFIAGGFYFKSKNSQNLHINTIQAQKQNLELNYEITAYVESKKIVNVFSSNIAEVENLNYRLNDYVEKGEILLTLRKDKTDVAEYSIEKLKLLVANLEDNYEKLKKLYNIGGISKVELETSKLNLENARIDLKAALNGFKTFEKELKSPISGVIIEANVDNNYKIDPSRPLFKIADVENLIINGEISNIKAKNIKIGQKVIVKSSSLADNEILYGKVKTISKISVPSKTSNNLITKISVELDNYSTLKPGDLTNVTIVYDEINNNIVVPFQYISFENEKSYVYVVNSESKIVKKEITIGKNNNNIQYEIIDGINENEKLLDNSLKMYKEGDTLK